MPYRDVENKETNGSPVDRAGELYVSGPSVASFNISALDSTYLTFPELTDLRPEHNAVNEQIRHGSDIRFNPCRNLAEIERFIELRDSLPQDNLLMLTRYNAADYAKLSAALYVEESQEGGFGLTPDGKLISVFSLNGRGVGSAIVSTAIELGATEVSCFDIKGKLPGLYQKHGFIETQRYPWDRDKAPAKWNYDRFGEPDVIILRREVADLRLPLRPNLSNGI